jgi:hypothetical protein
VIDSVFRCHHKRTTRPITPAHKPGERAGDTYVACLECGKRLHYNLKTMRIGKPIPTSEDSGLQVEGAGVLHPKLRP